jgi:hypothetical protein
MTPAKTATSMPILAKYSLFDFDGLLRSDGGYRRNTGTVSATNDSTEIPVIPFLFRQIAILGDE